MRVKRNKYWIRIRTCWYILTGKYKHWYITNIDDENFKKFFKNQRYELDITYLGIRPYIFKRIIKNYARSIDDVDMILGKAQFDAEYDLWLKEKKKKKR
jgi:hypothetical protein